MKEMMPRVSVLVPVYNRTEYLLAAVQTLCAQTWPDLEVILADDGSDDETPTIIEAVAEGRILLPERERRQGTFTIRSVRQKHQGVSAARNLALSAASGSFIAFLDSDDLWMPEKAEKQVRYLLNNPTCNIVFCGYENFIDAGAEEISEEQRQLLSEVIPDYMASAMVRREVFDRIGSFSVKLRRGEDSEWVMRAKLLGENKGDMIPEVLYKRRIHAGNITLTRTEDDKFFEMACIAEMIRNVNMIRRKNGKDSSSDTGL